MVEVNRGPPATVEEGVENAERFMAVVMQMIGEKMGLPSSNNFREMTLQVRVQCNRLGIDDDELDRMIAVAMKQASTLSEFRMYAVSSRHSSQLSSLIMPRDDKSVVLSNSNNSVNKHGIAAAAVSDTDKRNRNMFNSMDEKDNDVQKCASEDNDQLPTIE